MQALALHSKKQHIPMPSKRTSAVYHPQLPRRVEATTGTSLLECVYDADINIEICSNLPLLLLPLHTPYLQYV